jgi:hypothetical protein
MKMTEKKTFFFVTNEEAEQGRIFVPGNTTNVEQLSVGPL